jgi:thiosulfate/3-mercaptopyruvate sulfurtransferase
VEERRPYEYGRPSVAAGNFRASLNPDVNIMKDDLKRIVKGPEAKQVTILDARSLEEYLGKEMTGIPRPGHIPGALSVPWNAFLNPDATLKNPEKIRATLEDRGLRDAADIVCYCTGGVRSGWLWFVLTVLGYPKVRNYAGSWWEWSRDFAAPVSKDAKGLQHVLNIDESARPS